MDVMKSPLVISHWSLVIFRHWLLVIGHFSSLVIGHWSLVIGHWLQSDYAWLKVKVVGGI